MQLRLRFQCSTVNTSASSEDVVLVPVDSPENKKVFLNTPSLQWVMSSVIKTAGFVPGTEYFIDISVATPTK